MLKPLVPKFRPDLSAHLRDIAEKQVPAKLKPIVGRISVRAGGGAVLDVRLARTGYWGLRPTGAHGQCRTITGRRTSHVCALVILAAPDRVSSMCVICENASAVIGLPSCV